MSLTVNVTDLEIIEALLASSITEAWAKLLGAKRMSDTALAEVYQDEMDKLVEFKRRVTEARESDKQ